MGSSSSTLSKKSNGKTSIAKLSVYDNELSEMKAIATVAKFWQKYAMKSRVQINSCIVKAIVDTLQDPKQKYTAELIRFDWVAQINRMLGLLLNVKKNFTEIQSLLSRISQICLCFDIDETTMSELWYTISHSFIQVLNSKRGDNLDSGMQYCLDMVALYCMSLIKNRPITTLPITTPTIDDDDASLYSNKSSLCLTVDTNDISLCGEDIDTLLSLSFLNSTKKCVSNKFGIKYLSSFLHTKAVPQNIISFLQEYRNFLYTEEKSVWVRMGDRFTADWMDTLVDTDIITINRANEIRMKWDRISENTAMMTKFDFHCLFELLFCDIFDWIDRRYLSNLYNAISTRVGKPIYQIRQRSLKKKFSSYSDDREDSIQL